MKIFLSVLVAFCVATAFANVQAVQWMTDYEKALQVAKQTNKPILIDFTGSDWCSWCKKLKSEVFDTPAFGKWVADKGIVLLEIDYPKSIPQPEKLKQQNERLQKQYKIEGFPTLVLLSVPGKELGRKVGFPQGGLEELKSWFDKLVSTRRS